MNINQERFDIAVTEIHLFKRIAECTRESVGQTASWPTASSLALSLVQDPCQARRGQLIMPLIEF